VNPSTEAFIPAAATIINLDDDEAGRYAKRRILEAAGYRVIDAGGGIEAVRLTRDTKAHLALLDVRLPDMNGLDVCRAIKNDPVTASTMVLLVSAGAVRREDRVTGLEEGADGYLIEPFEPDELLATVNALLRLHHSEQRLALALKATRDVVWEWDAVADRLTWNETGTFLFGWKEPAERGVPMAWWLERVHPDDRERIEAQARAALADAVQYVAAEYRFKRRDGGYASVHDRGYLVRDDQGRAVRMIGAMQDVTARKRTEDELRASEARFRRSADAAGALVFEVSLDDDRPLTAYGLERFLGLTERPARMDLDWWLSRIHPDDLSAYRAGIERQIQTGGKMKAAYRVRHESGSWLHVESYREVIADAAGRPIKVIGTALDATQRKEAEAAIRDRDMHLHLAMDASLSVAFEWDIMRDRVRRLHSSEQALPGTGERSDTFESVVRVVHPDDREAFRARVAAAQAGADGAYASEHRIVRPDGTVRWLAETGRIEFDADHRPIRLMGVSHDVTESKQAEQAMRAAVHFSSKVMDASLTGLYVYDVGRGRNAYVNTMYERLTGYSRAMLERLSGEQFMTLFHPDDAASITAHMDAIMAAQDGQTLEIEYRLKKADGTWMWCLSRNAVFERDGRGRVLRFIGSFLDITTRKQADAALRESEDRFRTLGDHMSQFAWIIDQSGEAVWFNRRWYEYTGTTFEQMRGWGWRQVHHPDHEERVVTSWRRALETGQPWEETFPLRGKDGAYRWFLTRAVPIQNEEGRIIRWFGTNTDVTAQREAEQALRVSEARYRRLIAVLPVAMYACDGEGRITFYNEQAAELWGRAPKIGDEDEKFCGAFRLFLPDGAPLPHDCNPMAEAIGWGTGYRNQEVVIERPDGTRRHVLVNIDPIKNDSGAIVGAINVFTDVTEHKRADEALRDSEARGRLAMEVGRMGSWDWNVATGDVQWSAGHFELLGLSPNSATPSYELWARRVHPEDRSRVEAHLREAMAAKTEYRADFRVVWPDGGIHWMAGRGRFEYGADGRCTRMIGVMQDMTERVVREAALRETEERLRLAVESAQVGTWDLNLVTGENRWDRRCKALFGLPAEVDVGYGEFIAMIHEDDRPRILHAIANATGPSSDGFYDAEYRILPADGRERWIRAMGRAFFEERAGERRAVRFTGTAIDMTERRQAESALREGERRLRLALEAGEMGAWDVDLRTNATAWDAKEFALLGLSVGSVDPSPEEFYRRVHPDDVAEVKRLVDVAFETGRLTGQFRIVHPDGAIRWLIGEGQIVRDERGRPVRMVGINYDVTERKQAEDRLRSFTQELEMRVMERTRELVQSQDRLRALATELNLAEQRERKRLATELHDHLAQMLVLGRLKLSQAKRFADPRCAPFLKETEDVLDESLKYTRTMVADLSPPVLHDLGLPAALRWLGDYMQRHELAVKVTISEPVEQVTLPEDQAVLLFQSVRELLINAAKHADTGAALVSLAQADGRLVVQVHDEGKGFDHGAAPAEQPATALSSKFGLFSIGERMRSLGGSLEIESAPGMGTTATLVLPVAEAQARGARQEARSHVRDGTASGISHPLAPRPGPLASTRIRVLLVDDHAMVRQGLRTVLDGYPDLEVVGEAWNGEEAVAAVERHRPALVVMDINMPKKNGIEATADIKSRYPHIHVIGLSVNAGGENQAAMLQAGAALLLTKEAAVDQLYEAIKKTLAGSVEPEGIER
jgi:PAS domain S-box-containing protein